MIRTRIFLILLICLSASCFAKQNAIDSLKKVIAVAPDDTNKVNATIELSLKYRSTSVDSIIFYASQAKELAEKINYQKGLGYALKALGLAYNDKSDYVKALQL